MCECIKTANIIAGFICCGCRAYNGLQRSICKQCEQARCEALLPDGETGTQFETYAQAYANEPDMLAGINHQLKLQSG